ncbi:MAG: hypothetical protein HDT15_11565 [Oscillibacter sp.]|nr:hypothetical protein [Oscillibacter sp.]
MSYFDSDEFRTKQKAFEQEIIRNYYRMDWDRLTHRRSWDARPEHLKELHRSFEYLRGNFPCTGEQAEQFLAEMERVRNALVTVYCDLPKA